jgi:hypothetical protein
LFDPVARRGAGLSGGERNGESDQEDGRKDGPQTASFGHSGISIYARLASNIRARAILPYGTWQAVSFLYQMPAEGGKPEAASPGPCGEPERLVSDDPNIDSGPSGT